MNEFRDRDPDAAECMTYLEPGGESHHRYAGRALLRQIGPSMSQDIGTALSAIEKVATEGVKYTDGLFGGRIPGAIDRIVLQEYFVDLIPKLNKRLGLGFTITEEEK